MLESPARLVLAAQVIREYLAVATRPIPANGLGMPMADALANLREFRRTLRLLPEEKPVLPTFLALLERVPCAGKRVHDAHIVATAVVHRVPTIVSLNAEDLSGFTREITVVGPGQALRAVGAVRREKRKGGRGRPSRARIR